MLHNGELGVADTSFRVIQVLLFADWDEQISSLIRLLQFPKTFINSYALHSTSNPQYTTQPLSDHITTRTHTKPQLTVAQMHTRKFLGYEDNSSSTHCRSLISPSICSPSFNTNNLSLLLSASRICGSTSGVDVPLGLGASSAGGSITPSNKVLDGCKSDVWEEEAVESELSTRRSDSPFTLLDADELDAVISRCWGSPGAAPAKLSSN